jgi:hypothetical protein
VTLVQSRHFASMEKHRLEEKRWRGRPAPSRRLMETSYSDEGLHSRQNLNKRIQGDNRPISVYANNCDSPDLVRV